MPVATERLHVDGQTSLIFTAKFQDHLVQLWPVIAAITANQLQLASLPAIGLIIGTVDMNAGDIELYSRALEPSSVHHLRSHDLIQGADIGGKQRVQTPADTSSVRSFAHKRAG